MAYLSTSSKIKIYSNTIDALVLLNFLHSTSSQQNVEVYISNSLPEISIISEECLIKLQIDPQLAILTPYYLTLWKSKITLTRRDKKYYILPSEVILQQRSHQKVDNLPTLNNLISDEPESIKLIFNRYKSSYKTTVYKTILSSNINQTFVEVWLDNKFQATVVNHLSQMYVYLIGSNFTDQIIQYYQDLYMVNTIINATNEEEITPFEYSKYTPTTQMIQFLGYCNGIYNPFNIIDMDFKVKYYERLSSRLNEPIPTLLELKQEFSIDLSRFQREIEKIVYLL
ncbi:MAG: hypothetical protein ABDH21_00250 [bacterium]